MKTKLVLAGETIGIKTKKSLLARIFHKPPPEHRFAAGFPRLEHPKPVTARRSTLSPFPSGYELSGLKPLILIAGFLVWCGLNLHAQPVITNQPASQTNAPGTSASFSVGVTGTGPFAYQWRFNGTNLPNNIITTVAGTNGDIYSEGDGGAAINAGLNPCGVAFDAVGNLFIADLYNNRIRKVDTNGIITTVAGNGDGPQSGGYSGDGGAATNASLDEPNGVACDAFGNQYIGDTVNSRIRKLDTNGIITTVAGNGDGPQSGGYSGDCGAATNASLDYPCGVAFDASGNLFIADLYNNRIREVDTNGIITTVAGNGNSGYSGDGGAATNANLYYPYGVAFDTFGNLYICDSGNECIRKVDNNGNINTVVGNLGRAPSGVACDAFGNLYIAETFYSRILKLATNGIITTVAGNGSLDYPKGVACNAVGNLFIADEGYNCIRAVNFSTNPTFTLNFVNVTNAGNYTVVVTSPYGSVTSVVATLTLPGPAIIAKQPASQTVGVGSSPSFSVAIANSGYAGPFGYEWYFAGTNLVQSGTNNTLTLLNVSTNNTGNYTVVVTNNYGSVTSLVATLTVLLPPSVTVQPVSQTNLAGTTASFNVAVAGIGPFTYQWQFNGINLPNIITTVAGNNYAIYAGDGGPAINASLNEPAGVTFDAAGNLFIADQYNNRIRKVDTNGVITTVVGKSGFGYSGDGVAATNTTLYYPSGLAFDAFGNLFIADQYNNRIRKVNTNGIIATVAGKSAIGSLVDGVAATNSSLGYPSGVAFDAAGNLYIADELNERIRKVDINGIITTVAGKNGSSYSGDGGAATNASLYFPLTVTFDAFGNLYIADQVNNRIRKVDTNGVITTVAGNSGSSYSGDDGAATNASLNRPYGVAFDAAGNLYIADHGNNRIREVDSNGIITTVAGNGSSGYSGDGGAATNASFSHPCGMTFDASGNLRPLRKVGLSV